ncbi:MAG: threonyl-tRNA synthetase editing domain-containing protein [Candidatus Pacearchaeota archaeon]|jgi:threonyl-tRNA synthetase
MKALLFNAREYGVKFDSFANRPKEIFHEEINGKEEQNWSDCVVAFITIEKDDNKERVSTGISKAITKMCKEVNRERVAIVPFAHLSNNLGEPSKSFEIFEEIENKLKSLNLEIIRSHFGSNKSLHLDVYGHAGNARYREFN